MFNGADTKVRINTSEPSYLVVNNDTLQTKTESHQVVVKRSNEPLTVTAISDTISKTVSVKAKNSFAYWLNIYPNIHFWTGFYIDTKTKKRYAYPKTIYLQMTDTQRIYFNYQPINDYKSARLNVLKITPLKTIDLVNAAIELSYERKTGANFSTQIMAAYLLPRSGMYFNEDLNPEIKGYRLAIEERYFFKKTAPKGAYVALEGNYLNAKYNEIESFGETGFYYDSTAYSDSIRIAKQTVSVNFKIGYQFIYKRVSFDIYAGIGLRYKDVRHLDRINPDDKMLTTRHRNIYYYHNIDGQFLTISMPINLRVGWAF